MVPRVKICGITRADDAQCAQALGAAALGFVFWPGSPRFIEPAGACAIVRHLAPATVAIGVFVDQSVDHVRRIVREVGLGAVQLHGGEAVGAFEDVGAPLIKAIPIDDDFDPATVLALPPGVTVLLDAHDPVKRGGTGRTIDWATAAAIARMRPIILAGGLHAGNVQDAVARVRPGMIDVSSGIEAAPGRKDHGKLRALFRALEAA
jgi:phosphoribosylanthranilate isomerase